MKSLYGIVTELWDVGMYLRSVDGPVGQLFMRVVWNIVGMLLMIVGMLG